jgi:hypothetical protein
MSILDCDVLGLRTTIESRILDLYLPNSTTLKPQEDWPGFYTTKEKKIIPAVWVSGERMVPKTYKISGIECVIEDVPKTRNSPYSGSIISVDRWPVRFTNYGYESGTVMRTTLRQIQRNLSVCFPADESEHNPRTELTYETLTIRISSTHLLFPPT